MTRERRYTAPLPPRVARRGGIGGGGPLTESDNPQRKTDSRIPRARALRTGATTPERKLWRRLRELAPEHTHFRRQATIGNYFADFACHSTRVVIEVDGDGHASPQQTAIDAVRTEYLASQGYRVLRFSNHEVMGNIDGVMELIAAAVSHVCGNHPPPPTPPRRASRGRRGAEQRLRGHAE